MTKMKIQKIILYKTQNLSYDSNNISYKNGELIEKRVRVELNLIEGVGVSAQSSSSSSFYLFRFWSELSLIL